MCTCASAVGTGDRRADGTEAGPEGMHCMWQGVVTGSGDGTCWCLVKKAKGKVRGQVYSAVQWLAPACITEAC